MGGNNNNDRVASPKSVPIVLNKNMYSVTRSNRIILFSAVLLLSEGQLLKAPFALAAMKYFIVRYRCKVLTTVLS